MWHDKNSDDFRQQLNVITSGTYFTARVDGANSNFYTIIGREDGTGQPYVYVLDEATGQPSIGTTLAMSDSTLYLIEDERVCFKTYVIGINVLEN